MRLTVGQLNYSKLLSSNFRTCNVQQAENEYQENNQNGKQTHEYCILLQRVRDSSPHHSMYLKIKTNFDPKKIKTN